MVIILVIALLVAILASAFAIQNAVPIAVSFFSYRFEASLALVLLVTLSVGVMIGLLVSIPTVVRKSLEISSQKKKIAELETNSEEEGLETPPSEPDPLSPPDSIEDTNKE